MLILRLVTTLSAPFFFAKKEKPKKRTGDIKGGLGFKATGEMIPQEGFCLCLAGLFTARLLEYCVILVLDYPRSMKNVVVEVYGSGGDVYQVSFTALSGKALADCTCKAGSNGQFCKHRLALLAGDFGRLVEKPKAAEVREVLGWPEFSPILEQISRLHEIEIQMDELEKARASLKKAVGKVLGGR